MDLLVLDDGWFGKRNDDCSGLGDWFVNTDKLHGGLGALAEKINALGMKFGLWFEPEMASEDTASITALTPNGQYKSLEESLTEAVISYFSI